MSWIAFAVATWVCFGLETGLRDALRLGTGGVAPSFVVPLLCFISMHASPREVVRAALVLGLVADLTSAQALVPAEYATIVGPRVLAYAVAAQLVLALRGVVISQNPLTLGVLSVPASLVITIVTTALLTIRSFYDPIAIAPSHDLLQGLGTALFSGVSAIALALVLFPMSWAFGFHNRPPARFFSRR